MQKFFNLSSKQSVGLDKVIYTNSRKLYKDALIVAQVNKSYSTGTSLLILSLEETMKAVLLKLHSEEYKIYQIEDAHKFFRDHKIRHQLAQLIEMGSGLNETLLTWANKKEQRQIFRYKWLNFIWNGLQSGVPLLNAVKRIDQLQGFNDLKNKGFYVDYNDGLHCPQECIIEKDFFKTKEIVDRTIRFYKLLTLLFHPMMKNHWSQEEISTKKEALKIFIEEALTEDPVDFPLKVRMHQ